MTFNSFRGYASIYYKKLYLHTFDFALKQKYRNIRTCLLLKRQSMIHRGKFLSILYCKILYYCNVILCMDHSALYS